MMLAVSTTESLVFLDPKKPSSCLPPSCSLSSPTASAWTPDNSLLFVSHSAGIQKFDGQGRLQGTVYAPLQPPKTLICRDKNQQLIFSAGLETILLDAISGKVAHKFSTHKSPVTSLALSNDATLLSSITSDAAHVHNLSLNTSTTLRGLPLSNGSVAACTFHPHTRTRLLLGVGNLLVIYETTRPSGPAKTIPVGKDIAGKIVAITCSPFSNSLVALAFDEGFVALVDLDKDKGVFRILSLHTPLTSLLFSPEGAALYVGTDDGKVLLLDLRSLDKTPESITISVEGRRIVCMSVQRKLKPAESASKPTSSAKKSLVQQEAIKVTTTRRVTSGTTMAVPVSKATTTRTKPETIISPPRIRTTTSATTMPARSRVASTATVNQPTPSSRPPVRVRTVSTLDSPSAPRVPSVPARPATVAGRASGTSPALKLTNGPLAGKRRVTPIKSPVNKSVISDRSNRLDVSVSIDNQLNIPETTRKENLSPQGMQQRTVSSLSVSSRTTRTRTISTTSQRSATSSRAMTSSIPGTSVSGASSISRAKTARPAKSSTSTKPAANTRKSSKEWAAGSMSPIPPVPPLPIAFGDPEPLTAIKCPVPRDRTPSPDPPSSRSVPITPLPPSRAAKGKAPDRHIGVLGLGTPDVQRWIAAGENDKGVGRKVSFTQEVDAIQLRSHSPVFDDDEEPQEAKIEMTVQISPRRAPASATPWTPAPSPLRNSLGNDPSTLPGPSTNPAQDLLSNLIRDALYDFRRETKAEIVGLHLDLVNMGRGWKKEMKDAMEQWGNELQAMREENQQLKEENEILRRRIY